MNYLYDQGGRKFACMTPREFAARYDVTERSVYNWMTWGMPSIAFGDDVSEFRLIPIRLADDWVEAMIRKGVLRSTL